MSKKKTTTSRKPSAEKPKPEEKPKYTKKMPTSKQRFQMMKFLEENAEAIAQEKPSIHRITEMVNAAHPFIVSRWTVRRACEDLNIEWGRAGGRGVPKGTLIVAVRAIARLYDELGIGPEPEFEALCENLGIDPADFASPL